VTASNAKPLPQLPLNDETRELSHSLIWFEPPEKALAYTERFVAYAVAHATLNQMAVLRRYLSDDEFRIALDNAPPGIIDPRSWSYGHAIMGCHPPPPLPVRRIGDWVGPTTYGKTAASINAFLEP
jgi:hypothetical protein